MTLQSILQKAREEFDKLIQPYQEHCCDSYRHSREDADKCKKMHGYCGYELDHGFDLSDMQSLHDESKNLLAHHQSEIVDEIIRTIHQSRRDEKEVHNETRWMNCHWNNALDSIISELKKVK